MAYCTVDSSVEQLHNANGELDTQVSNSQNPWVRKATSPRKFCHKLPVRDTGGGGRV